MSSLIKRLTMLMALGVALVGFTGCIEVSLQDKSATVKYRQLVGSTFALKTEFKVYGVRRDLRSEVPDYYEMLRVPGPGIGGPEIMDFGRLPAGSRLRLVAAYEEALGGYSLYEVIVLDPAERKFEGLRIRINNAGGLEQYHGGTYPGGAPKLNPEWFTEFTPPAS